MLASVFSWLRRPAFILLGSFVIGVLIDAAAERLAAQAHDGLEILSASSHRRVQDTQQAQQDQSPSDVVQQSTSLLGDDELRQSIMDIQLTVRDPAENKPVDESAELFARFGRSNYPSSFQQRLAMWRAPDIRYRPLYFEDVRLERYGQTRGLFQPVSSALHLAASHTLLPYNMWVQHPQSCVYPLGYCRPGSLAPAPHTRWLGARRMTHRAR